MDVSAKIDLFDVVILASLGLMLRENLGFHFLDPLQSCLWFPLWSIQYKRNFAYIFTPQFKLVSLF